MEGCYEYCVSCCCPSRTRSNYPDTAPAKQPLLPEQQAQPGTSGNASGSAYQPPSQQMIQQPGQKQADTSSSQVASQPAQQQPSQAAQGGQLKGQPGFQQPAGQPGLQQPANQSEPAYQQPTTGGWGETISSTLGGVATSVVGDQLSQKLTSWLGGGGNKEAGNAAGATEAGGAEAGAQQAPASSEGAASGYQGDESFMHVPEAGTATDSSGFEEVQPVEDDLGADDADDDDAYD